MSNEKEVPTLFRQQVIDEFNSKLNGEVILRPNYTKFFIVFAALWLALGITLNSVIKVDVSERLSGTLSLDDEKNITAVFYTPPALAEHFYPEKIINVKLTNILDNNQINVTAKIKDVDKNLVIDEMSHPKLRVDAIVQQRTIFIDKNEFILGEGIPFFIATGNRKISVVSWIKNRYFSGDSHEY